MTVRDWLQRHPLLYLWLPVVAWMGLIFWLSAQPYLPNPGEGWTAKLISMAAHAFMFGVLAALFARALGELRHVRYIALVLTLLYALSDEFHQAFVPGRHPDAWDLLFDTGGAVLALLVWGRLQQ
ncbi:MAG: VanZ family protein [Anaerolineae bacterium]|jgi:VanZ family protein